MILDGYWLVVIAIFAIFALGLVAALYFARELDK